MPSYEFKCPECDLIAEIVYSFADTVSSPECPECELTMARLYAVPALQFKGTGWGKDPK